MSWKPYMINAIDNYSGSFLMDCKFSEIHTMLKRSDNFGQFYESVEKYLAKTLDELGDELDWVNRKRLRWVSGKSRQRIL